MARIKNRSSGIVHVEGVYIHTALCGAIPYSFTSLTDAVEVTCKNCLRVLKAEAKEETAAITKIEDKTKSDSAFDDKIKPGDWVKVTGKGNEVFVVLCVKEKSVGLRGGTTEPLYKVEKIDPGKYEINEYTNYNWYEICKYPNCVHYSKKAEYCCCNTCSADAFEEKRLETEKRKMEDKRKELSKYIRSYNKTKGFRYSLLLPKTAEALAYFTEKYADIHEDTTLSDIIVQALENYHAYLKESL